MKKIITYLLVALSFVAFNYKSINYVLKTSSVSFVYNDDNNCEDENSKPEKSNEKEEKKNIQEECLFSHSMCELTPLVQLSFKKHSEILFTTSDYSLSVYFPPENSIS